MAWLSRGFLGCPNDWICGEVIETGSSAYSPNFTTAKFIFLYILEGPGTLMVTLVDIRF